MSKKARLRSSLSFEIPDGTLDISTIIKQEPWNEIKTIENSELGQLQKLLNSFNDVVHSEKKKMEVSKETKKKSLNCKCDKTVDETSKTLAQKPIVKKSVVKKSTVKKSAAKNSVVDKTTVKELTTKEPVLSQLTTKESNEKRLDAEKASIKKSIPKKSVINETALKKSSTKIPVIKDSQKVKLPPKNSLTNKLTTNVSVIREPSEEEPIINESTTSKSVVNKSTKRKSIVKKSLVNESVINKTSVNKPRTNKSTVKNSLVNVSFATEPTMKNSNLNNSLENNSILETLLANGSIENKNNQDEAIENDLNANEETVIKKTNSVETTETKSTKNKLTKSTIQVKKSANTKSTNAVKNGNKIIVMLPKTTTKQVKETVETTVKRKEIKNTKATENPIKKNSGNLTNKGLSFELKEDVTSHSTNIENIVLNNSNTSELKNSSNSNITEKIIKSRPVTEETIQYNNVNSKIYESELKQFLLSKNTLGREIKNCISDSKKVNEQVEKLAKAMDKLSNNITKFVDKLSEADSEDNLNNPSDVSDTINTSNEVDIINVNDTASSIYVPSKHRFSSSTDTSEKDTEKSSDSYIDRNYNGTNFDYIVDDPGSSGEFSDDHVFSHIGSSILTDNDNNDADESSVSTDIEDTSNASDIFNMQYPEFSNTPIVYNACICSPTSCICHYTNNDEPVEESDTSYPCSQSSCNLINSSTDISSCRHNSSSEFKSDF